MLKFCTVLCIIFYLLGCSNTITNDRIDREIYTFRGLYLNNNEIGNIGSRKTDSLVLTILNNHTYSMRFYDVAENDIDFCSHSGIIENFWTNSVTFYVDVIDYNNCDTINLPRKYFTADFVNHGDTVLLEQISGDTLRRFTLVR